MPSPYRHRRLSGLPISGKYAAAFLLLALNVLASFAELKADANSPVEQAKPWLGVAIDEGKHGVLVKDVLANTPAAAAGFKAGDEITAIDAKIVKKPEELILEVKSHGVGNWVTVHYWRAGKTAKQKVKLVARPDELEMLKNQLVNKPAPDFALKTVMDRAPALMPARLKDLKGQVVIVEFWATWCPACRSTHARLSAFAQQNANKVRVLAVSNEDVKSIENYATKLKPHFTLIQDPTEDAHKAYRVAAIPEIVVIGKDGMVAFATIGAGDYLEEALAVADKLAR